MLWLQESFNVENESAAAAAVVVVVVVVVVRLLLERLRNEDQAMARLKSGLGRSVVRMGLTGMVSA